MINLTADQFLCLNCKQRKLHCSGIEEDAKNFSLQCSSCDASYPVISGVARFAHDGNYSDSFGYQWNKFSKTQLDSYTGIPISKTRLYKAVDWEDDVKGKRLLEAGSGAGRFTEVLAEMPLEIFSFDYSSAVEANQSNNGNFSNLTIFQADIFNIPFDSNYFDYVICLGVLQHTPDPRLAFHSLVDKVKPGGLICIDCYALKWHHFIQWKYLLRPLTKKINPISLFTFLSTVTPFLISLTKFLKRFLGRFGARLMPIVEYSELGLNQEINKEWAILDTFDMYSPEHDHPQSLKTVKKWFLDAGLQNIEVEYGDNGVVGRGRRPD